MDMKKAAIAALGLAVGFVAGYGAGRVSTGTPINPLSVGKGGYEEGYAAAAKKLADSGLVPPAPTEARSLSGLVKSSTGNLLVFEADLNSSNPLIAINAPKERRVTVSAATKIYRLVPKTPEEIAAATTTPFDENGRPLPPPSLMRQEAITLADIKPGEYVTVTAENDVLRAETFVAVDIFVAPPAPQVPSTPPAL